MSAALGEFPDGAASSATCLISTGPTRAALLALARATIEAWLGVAGISEPEHRPPCSIGPGAHLSPSS